MYNYTGKISRSTCIYKFPLSIIKKLANIYYWFNSLISFKIKITVCFYDFLLHIQFERY